MTKQRLQTLLIVVLVAAILALLGLVIFGEKGIVGKGQTAQVATLGIQKLTLVSVTTGKEIRSFGSGETVDLNLYKKDGSAFSIKAIPIGAVRSIKFNVNNGEYIHNENAAPFTLAGDGNGGTTYLPPPFVPGGTYSIVVTPYGGHTGTGTVGTPAKITLIMPPGTTVPPPTTLMAPTNVTALPGNRQVALSWSPVANATSYRVQQSTSNGGPFTTVTTFSGTTMVNTGLTNGTTYYYVVSAIAGNQQATSSTVSAMPMGTPAQSTKISVTEDMVANMASSATTGSHRALFDGDTRTYWEVRWEDLRPYQIAVIDLGRPYAMTEVKYFKNPYFNTQTGFITVRSCRKKTWAEGQAETSKSNPLACTDLFTDNLTGSTAEWVSRQVLTTNRYLEVQLGGVKTLIGEVEFYGTPAGTATPLFEGVASSSNRQYPLMDDFIGVNAFNGNPADQLAMVAGHERDYLDISWLNGGDYDPTTNPGTLHPVGQHQSIWCASGFLCNDAMKFEAASGFFFDTKYQAFKNAGLKVFPAIKQCLRGGFAASRESVCIPGYDIRVPGYNNNPQNLGPQEEDPFNPYSYRAVAEIFFQVAARYGKVQVPTSLLKLRAGQQVRTGLNLIDALEAGNEEAKTWEGIKAWHSAYMEAARLSAIYDGHMNTIRQPGRNVPHVGIKAADPTLPVVIGGLNDVTTEPGKPDLAESRFNLIRLWSSVYRNGAMPMDVLNVHHYTQKRYATGGEGGASPEEGKLREFGDKMVLYSKTHWNNAPVWLTELGFDTGGGGLGSQGGRPYKNFSAQEVQAMWDVRSLLELAPTRIQRATIYMFPDSCGDPVCDSAGQYSTSGLAGSIAGNFFPRKISFYWMATMKNILAETRFSRDLSTSAVRHYEFKRDDGMKTVHVFWSPTADDVKVTNFATGINTNGTIIQLPNITTEGCPVTTNGTIPSNCLSGVASVYTAGSTITVSEVPTFIVTYIHI